MKKILLLLLSIYTVAVKADNSILVVTENLWPFNYVENNEVKGPHTQIVKRLLAHSNIDYTMAVLPWARAYKLAKTRPNILIYTINHTASRHKDFHWIGDFPSQATINFYALKSSNLKELSTKQLKTLRIGTQIATANDSYVTDNGFKYISRVSHVRQTVGMLKLGRVDLVIASPKQIAQAARENNLPEADLIKIGYAFSSKPAIAVSLLTPQVTVKALQKSFIELKKMEE